MEASEIRKILKLANKFGVKELSFNGLSVKFIEKRKRKRQPAQLSFAADASKPNFPPSTPNHSPTQPIDLTSEGIPTEDELLLMSTPFYDHMQMLKHLKEEVEPEQEASPN